MSPLRALRLRSVLGLASLWAATFAAPPAFAVDGYVDLHSHLMAEYSFGGGFLWGRAAGPVNPAVVRCDGAFPAKTHATTRYPIVGELLTGMELGDLFGEDSGDTGWHLGKRRGYDERRCRRFLGITIPGTCPRPHFEGWPTWTTHAHQQMWQGWLQQAQQGGLRIMMVSLAESNFLCLATPTRFRRYGCDEMASVSNQLARLREFASTYASWVGIAETPAQARSLIAQGKLALVPSVEITRLFPSGDFLSQLDQWRNQGIRSVQIVHHADNRFAGATQIASLKTAADVVEILEGETTGINDIVCRDAAGNSGTCNGDNYLNVRGLTGEGQTLVQGMMDRGMLLDVSHLSRRSFRDVYNLALPRTYPLIYSHTHLFDTIDGKKNEKFLRTDEIHMITDTGGMIGLRTGPEATFSYKPLAGAETANICRGSSRSFAHSLEFAVDHGLRVGFGADLNGFARQMKPRTHSSCPTDRALINAAGGPNWFQSKGFGHVGLFPELMADLRLVGVAQPYLDELNQSAETFLRIWERSQSLAVPVPTNLARSAQVLASSTYCSGANPGPDCYSAARVNDGSRSTALGGLDSWANAWGVAMPQWVELLWQVQQTVSRVDVYTTTGFVLQSYSVQVWNGAVWVTVASVTNNSQTSRSHTFAPVATNRVRILANSGSAAQPGYARLNEIEVY